MLLEIGILILIGIFIGISNSAGIGGGTIINVLLIAGLDYTAKESIIVTYIFLMGGGLAATIASAQKFTAQGKRFINYDLVVITLPMMMSGAIVGVLFSIVRPFITVIFIVLILNLMRSSYYKMKEIDKQQSLISKEVVNIPPQDFRQENHNERLAEILAQENQLFPKQKIKIIIQIYVYTVVLILFKGGQNFNSIIGLEECGIGSLLCTAFHIILSFLYCKSIAMQKFQQDNQKQSLGFIFQNQKEKMTYQKMREGMFNGFIAGVLGACVAIGGGLVLIPLWLKAGIDKDIVTSSTAPLIFFSSSISFIISALLGQYDSILLIILFFALSFTSSYVIKNVIVYLMQKYKLKKLLFILLLFTMALSLLVFLPLQYQKYQEDQEQFMQFDLFC